MKRLVTSIIAALVLAAGCSSSDTTRETSGERIVTLTAGLTEAVFALGAGDLVVARDISSTIAEADALPIVTTAHDINVEALLAVRPTLILIDEDTGPETALDQIAATGVRIELVDNATTVDEIIPRLERVAEILGLQDRAARLRDAIDKDLAGVRTDDSLADVRVAFLYVRGPAGVYLIGGPGSGPDSIIAAAGATDAGTAIGLELAFTPLTPEAMVGAAPDVLLVTTTGLDSVNGIDGLVELAGVAQTPAGKARRVITAEDGLLFSFGPRTPSLIESLRQEIAAEMEKAVP
ncbi:MAG: ABC transporter substrate-binding protein [Actinobacteria bacterium]|nr:ABC transporter substrate-binding protein [Actinomycetota bacterium]